MLNQKHLKEAVRLHQSGQYGEAEKRYRALLRQEPRNPHLLHFLGLINAHNGQSAEAIELIDKAILLNPNIPEFYQSQIANYEKAGDKTKLPNLYNLLGNAFQAAARFEEAVKAYDQSLLLKPGDPYVMGNRGGAIIRQGKTGEAEKQYRETIRKLKNKARTPDDYLTLANASEGLGERDAALGYYRRAIAIKPDFAPAHFNQSFLMLLHGNLKEGWAEHEWRWAEGSTYVEKARIGFSQPEWKGETPDRLKGPLLVIAEQGYGDAIHFARYVSLLAEAGHDVLFEVQQPVARLFAEGLKHPRIRVIPRKFHRLDKWRLGGLGKLMGLPVQAIASDKIYRDLPFAAWVGLLSLPFHFDTVLETIPGPYPYLGVARPRVARWRRRLNHAGARLKVGLVWAGDPKHADDRKRSVPPEKLRPLLERTDIVFYLLQKGKAAEYDFGRENVISLDRELKDFTDTAAAIENLDLVITVDTSVAHLAGALNRPVWIMMPKVKDWRWLMEGETTGWYPSARLFRQSAPGDWESVIAAVGAALDEMPA